MLKDYLFYFEDERGGYTFFVETEKDKYTAMQIALDNMKPTDTYLLEYNGVFTPDQAEMLGYDTY